MQFKTNTENMSIMYIMEYIRSMCIHELSKFVKLGSVTNNIILVQAPNNKYHWSITCFHYISYVARQTETKAKIQHKQINKGSQIRNNNIK